MRDLYHRGKQLTLLDAGMFIPSDVGEKLFSAMRDPTVLNSKDGRSVSFQSAFFWNLIDGIGDVGVLPDSFGEVENFYGQLGSLSTSRNVENPLFRNSNAYVRFNTSLGYLDDIRRDYSQIRLLARQNVFGLPSDASYGGLVDWTLELKSHFKEKFNDAISDREDFGDSALHDARLFAAGLYRCFLGLNTDVYTKDIDFPRLVQSTSRVASLEWGKNTLFRELIRKNGPFIRYLPPGCAHVGDITTHDPDGWNMYYQKNSTSRHFSPPWELSSIKPVGRKLSNDLSLIVSDIASKRFKN